MGAPCCHRDRCRGLPGVGLGTAKVLRCQQVIWKAPGSGSELCQPALAAAAAAMLAVGARAASWSAKNLSWPRTCRSQALHSLRAMAGRL